MRSWRETNGAGCANPHAIAAVERPFEGSPWSARVSVPPFSAVYFEFWRAG